MRLTPLRAAKSVTTIARHRSPAVALTNFHKSTTRDEFTITPRNCIIEVAAKLTALSRAPLRQLAKLLQDRPRRTATIPPPIPFVMTITKVLSGISIQ
jgi:hypothetical protein